MLALTFNHQSSPSVNCILELQGLQSQTTFSSKPKNIAYPEVLLNNWASIFIGMIGHNRKWSRV